jgi:hypothetical protein
MCLVPYGTAWRLGVSGRNCCLRERTISRPESLPEAGAEHAVVDGAANLEQQIGLSLRPAHLLRLVHPAIHQEVGCAFGDRGASPQSGPVPRGVICDSAWKKDPLRGVIGVQTGPL